MAKQTFRFQQPLTSSEFGSLLFNLIQPGVYVRPVVSLTDLGSSSKKVTVSQGAYLFYDSTNLFAVSVQQDKNGDQDNYYTTVIPASPEGCYIYLDFNYSPVSASSPQVHVVEELEWESKKGSPDVILLGRIRLNASGAFEFDDSLMKFQSPGYSFKVNGVSGIDYKVHKQILTVSFTGNFQSDNKYGVVATKSFSSVTKEKAYFLYVDSQGEAQLTDVTSQSGISYLGKTILAYKNAGDEFFTEIRFPDRTEITADSLELRGSLPAQSDKNILQNILTDASTTVSVGGNAKKPVLGKVVLRLCKELIELRKEHDQLKKDFDALKSKVDGFATSFQTGSLKVTTSSTISGTVNFENAQLTFKESDFGTPTKPVRNMYITGVLYAEDLTYFSK